VPAAIHVTPEATMQGMISKIQEGDIIIVDTVNGILNVDIEENILKYRSYTDYQHNNTHIIGQNLFKFLQQNISSAEEGATSF
jgi:phosphogluconate dehydratase